MHVVIFYPKCPRINICNRRPRLVSWEWYVLLRVILHIRMIWRPDMLYINLKSSRYRVHNLYILTFMLYERNAYSQLGWMMSCFLLNYLAEHHNVSTTRTLYLPAMSFSPPTRLPGRRTKSFYTKFSRKIFQLRQQIRCCRSYSNFN